MPYMVCYFGVWVILTVKYIFILLKYFLFNSLLPCIFKFIYFFFIKLLWNTLLFGKNKFFYYYNIVYKSNRFTLYFLSVFLGLTAFTLVIYYYTNKNIFIFIKFFNNLILLILSKFFSQIKIIFFKIVSFFFNFK